MNLVDTIAAYCVGVGAIVASNAQYLIYKPMIFLQSKKLYGCPADVFRTREEAEVWVKQQLEKSKVSV